MTHGDGGKGSARRPKAVSDLEYFSRWDAIFQRDQPTTHHFVHDGWGKYHCKVCGRKEDHSSHGEECKGEQK